jgi:pimeloyl-ACP methyl ester carboxylesterase
MCTLPTSSVYERQAGILVTTGLARKLRKGKCWSIAFQELRRMAFRNRLVLKILVPLALLATMPVLAIAAIRYSTGLAARILQKRYPPPGRMVSVGGFRLQLYCMGSGQPAVVIEPGMGVDWVGWRSVIARLTPSHTVCVYDRAGYGWSDPGPKPRTAGREAYELHTLLTAARVAQPYILVAHSFGAYIARIYASRFPESLAGVVLVEPSHEDEPNSPPPADGEEKRGRSAFTRILNWLPPLGIQRLKRLYRGGLPDDLRSESRAYQERYLVASSLDQLSYERNEYDSLAFTKSEVRQAMFPPHLPLTVITALHVLSPRVSLAPEFPPIHRELQRRLAESSIYGRQILAFESGHMVPFDQPGLIGDAVRGITGNKYLPTARLVGSGTPLSAFRGR